MKFGHTEQVAEHAASLRGKTIQIATNIAKEIPPDIAARIRRDQLIADRVFPLLCRIGRRWWVCRRLLRFSKTLNYKQI